MNVTEKIKQLLDENSVSYELAEHVPVHTSAEAAKIRDTGLEMGAKALVCLADKEPVLVVVPGHKKLDLKKFKKNLGKKDFCLASPEKVFELTGLRVGSIPPVGAVLGLKSFFDSSFDRDRKVAFNAGSLTVSVIMDSKDLLKIEEPTILELT